MVPLSRPKLLETSEKGKKWKKQGEKWESAALFSNFLGTFVS
jgi:hypothetical protein